ncbi:putative serine dehydratase domain-containing protein [Aspergillus ambiguus]|uniref:putative serine dehydratase domain-containing protein n=1 Tax=Aspergillus ambiguus TaxID=176160 RepID=UPI003CCDB999
MGSIDFPSRPLPSEDDLKRFYVGKDIGDVPKPAAVLDLAIVKRHCEAMLEAVKRLNVGFRAHVKTHKTLQVASLQVGNGSGEANFVVSTLAEAELLVPLLKDIRTQGRKVNVLYGIPLVPSQVPRLGNVAREVGEGSVSVMIDHPDQLDYLTQFRDIAGFAAGVFLKVDTGYHRAGVPPTMLNKNGLLERIAVEERAGRVALLGVYSHSSLSYAATSPEQAMSYLKTEIAGCREALRGNSHLLPTDRELVISVGATPQAVSAHNLLEEHLSSEARDLKAFVQSPDQKTGAPVKIELHAGVYTVLDMQQMATNARHLGQIENELALSVLAEVCSVYNNGERTKPEALVAAGTLALGREPCQSYPGWGMVANWKQQSGVKRLMVERISQEHGIISWLGGDGPEIPLQVGQSVRIYPNHACITGALYGWYLIVDSSQDDDSKIVDVWVRVSGW